MMKVKLTLKKETLRELVSAELNQVVSGSATDTSNLLASAATDTSNLLASAATDTSNLLASAAPNGTSVPI